MTLTNLPSSGITTALSSIDKPASGVMKAPRFPTIRSTFGSTAGVAKTKKEMLPGTWLVLFSESKHPQR